MKRDMIQALLDGAKVVAAGLLVFILLHIAGACTSAYQCPAYGQAQHTRR